MTEDSNIVVVAVTKRGLHRFFGQKKFFPFSLNLSQNSESIKKKGKYKDTVIAYWATERTA